MNMDWFIKRRRRIVKVAAQLAITAVSLYLAWHGQSAVQQRFDDLNQRLPAVVVCELQDNPEAADGKGLVCRQAR